MAENWKQQVYSDFSGGYNDISPGIDIQDKEMKISENADYAAEVKALQTRKGCSKVNTEAYGANVTDGYAWLIGSTYKKCIVMGGVVYDISGLITHDPTPTPAPQYFIERVHYVPYDTDDCLIYPTEFYTGVYLAGDTIVGTGKQTTTESLKDLVYNNEYYYYFDADDIVEGSKSIEAGWYFIRDYDIKSTADGNKYIYSADKLIVDSYAELEGEIATQSEKEFKCMLSSGSTHIYPYIIGNVLYFGDGQELWQWGATDYSTESGTKSIAQDKIVKCNYLNNLPTEDFKSSDRTQDIKVGTFVRHSVTGKVYKSLKERTDVDLEEETYSNTTNWVEIAENSYGEKGHFYISVKSLGAVNLKHENFKDTTKWEDVTDVKNFTSSIVRKVTAYDPSSAEEVLITVSSGATAAGTVTVCLDNVSKTFTVTDGEVVSSIVDKLSKVAFDDWTAAVTGNAVLFSAKDKGSKVNGYVDPATSGITFTYETQTEGKENDCDLTAIKKCTIFCVHQGSQRVFAAGNPEDNGLYYSEIGYGNYFKSEINKVYPSVNGYGAVTGMINLSSALLVAYESGWCAWTGATVLSDATWKILNIPYGCVSARTLCLTPNSFTYLGKDGVYCVSAAILSDDYVLLESSSVIKKLSENTVENTILEFNNKGLCEAVFYDNVYMLTYSTNGEYCDKILKYEWDTSSFTLVTGWRVNRWLSDPENLYFASNNFVLKAFDTYSDVYTEEVKDENSKVVHAIGDNKAIELHVKTKEFYFTSPITNKVVQMIGFIFQQHNNVDSKVEITIHAGYKKFTVKAADLAESLYYGREWGKVWGYREAIVKMVETVMVSNTFQIEIKNSSVEDPITLIGIGFVYDTTDLVMPTILKDEDLLK